MLNRSAAADEAALLSTFNTLHDKKSPDYEKSRFGNDGRFTIKHFAGSVTYQIAGFLEKNNDALQEDLMELMVFSSNEFLQNAIVNRNKGIIFSELYILSNNTTVYNFLRSIVICKQLCFDNWSKYTPYF